MATAYVYKRTALFRDNAPLSAAGVTSVDGFVIDGIEPAGTRRRVLFSHESSTAAQISSLSTQSTSTASTPSYYKLTIDGTGKATETKVDITNITAEAVLENGNTIDELASTKSIPDFGKSFQNHSHMFNQILFDLVVSWKHLHPFRNKKLNFRYRKLKKDFR